MVADLLTAFAVVALASAAIGAVLQYCADAIQAGKDDE
jgi:hypothetical protein